LARLSFLWCYGVFHCFVLLRVVLVFKDIIQVIIILYIRDIWLSVSTFGRMCGTMHFWLSVSIIYVSIWLSWVMHTMSTWFGIKTGYDIA
jgi:hypothetical protein